MKKIFCILAISAACGASVFALGESESAAPNDELNGKTFASISVVAVEGAFCDVEIAGSDADQVKVDLQIEDELTAVRHEVKGGTLHLWVERESELFNWTPAGKNVISLSLPAGVDCRVGNSSGNIKIEKHSASRIELSTASGKITAAGCSAKMTLGSASGDIELADSEGDVTAVSASGGQRLKNLKGPIRSRTSSGSMEFTAVTGDINAKTTSGSVSLKSVTDGTIDVTSTSGGQKLAGVSGTLRLASSSGGLTGENVTLAGDSVFQTTSGEISLELANLEDCIFSLSSVSGKLSAGTEKAKRTLEAGDGSIKVKARSTSGNIEFN
jgi:hypothetical protein